MRPRLQTLVMSIMRRPAQIAELRALERQLRDVRRRLEDGTTSALTRQLPLPGRE